MIRRLKNLSLSLSLLLLSALVSPSLAAPATIDTVAGGGPDGIPALHANLLLPGAVAVDAQGTLHFTAQHRVYKVDAAGVIHVVAGIGGNRSGGGDGLPAPNGGLYYPRGILFDGAGNLLITDTFNGRVRRVDALTGIITTFAGGGSNEPGDGGPATSARVRSPVGLALDSSGNLYIAEMHGNRVRRVDAGTGIITTVAGGGSSNPGDGGPGTAASLATPTHLAIDNAAGILYISETQRDRVRTLNLGSGTIGTLFSASQPSGLALDAAAGNLYVSSLPGQILRRNLSTGTTTTLAAGFDFWTDWSDGGLALDGAGHLLVADSGNNLVRRVTLSSGAVATVAGNGSDWYGEDGFQAKQTYFNYPFSTLTDSAGNLFVAEDRIRRVDAATGLVSTLMGIPPGGGASIPVPTGYLSTDPGDNLYIATINSQVFRRDPITTALSVLAGTGTSGFSGDGGPAVAAELSDVLEAEVDGAGNLYLADHDNNRVRRVDAATGIITTVAGNGLPADSGDGGPAVAAGMRPIDLVVDAQGNLLISSNCRLRRVDAATGIITTVAGNGVCASTGDGGPAVDATVNRPLIGRDAAGNLYLTDFPYRQVRRVSASTGVISLVAGSGEWGFWGDGGPALDARFDSLMDLAGDASGNVLLVDFNFRVRKLTFAAGSAPVAHAGADAQADCTSAENALVTLDGSGSTDPDSTPGTNDDIVSFEWLENYGGADQTLLGTGETYQTVLPPGSHLVTLRVTDAAGASDTDEVVVSVAADTTPPSLTVAMGPEILHPPNKKFVPVHATIQAADACGAVSVVLVGVTSSDSSLPGGAVPGTEIRDADYGTADFDFELRADRGAGGSGRIYTITYRATDAAGNQVLSSDTVAVGHPRRGGSQASTPTGTKNRPRSGPPAIR